MIRRPTMIGIPVDSAGKPDGCADGPRVLRRYGLAAAVNAQNDLGDLSVQIVGGRDAGSGVIGYESVLHLTTTVRNEVRRVLEQGEQPLLVGGCCSFAMGAIAGARDVYGRIGLAYVDGHLDLYDGKTSPTGDCADMPFAFLVGLAPPELARCMGVQTPVALGDTALLGFRDLEDARSKGSVMPEDLGGDLFLADDRAVIEPDPGGVGEFVRERLERGPGRYWIHLDFDVLSDQVFPAVDYSSPGGLNWPQLLKLLRPLLRADGLIGLSLACYNPDLDPGHRCAAAAVGGLRELFS